jgi:two-component system sensor histidine kinase KdpD
LRYAATLLPVGAASLVSWIGRSFFDQADIAMLHLLAVLVVAIRSSRGPAIFAAFLSDAAFDFLVVPPHLTFHIQDVRYAVTLAVMLAVGLTVSTLAVRVRRQAEIARERERRAAALHVAAETERTRSAFLAAVSHDLRTPLASITGSAGALLEPASSLGEEERRELALTIRDESERLGRMVRDLLEMTRLDAGGVEPRRDWYPVDELVASALGRLDFLLADRDVRLDLAPDLPLVPVDGTLFEQLLVNLLENAARHTPRASPIEIRAVIEGDSLVLEVADRGPGLPAGEERRIFDRFHRSHAAGGGFGLGLTVCEAITRVHGGTIEAANRDGGGAVFRVRLPLVGTPPALEPQE